MIRLAKSLKAWGSPDFESVLKNEIEALDGDQLPLQQGLSSSSTVTDARPTVMINGVSEGAASLHVRIGVFYKGILTGCSCADDPTPVEEQNEYCEVQLDINKTTGETTIIAA